MTADNNANPAGLENLSLGVKIDGSLLFDAFRGVHISCDVTERYLGTENSTEIDASTSDPKPVFSSRLYCLDHDVSSAIEKKVGF